MGNCPQPTARPTKITWRPATRSGSGPASALSPRLTVLRRRHAHARQMPARPGGAFPGRGSGINPLGDQALAGISEWWTADRCYCDGVGHHGRGTVQGPEPPRAAGPAGHRGQAGPRSEIRKHRRSRRVTRVAAIDCGTNSIRLLIADVEQTNGTASLKDVVREMRVVRLGQGVDATGELAPEALERTLAATADYAALIREHGAARVRFVATSASRDPQPAGLRDVIRDPLGVEPEVIRRRGSGAVLRRCQQRAADPGRARSAGCGPGRRQHRVRPGHSRRSHREVRGHRLRPPY